jgi:hypothetical protein
MDLSGVPKSERELYGINQEQIRRLEQRQKDLMALKEDLPKTDKIGRGSLQKEYGKINRWLGDLRQAPETFVNVNMEGLSDKRFGEAIHTHTRRVMDRFRLDTRPAKQQGSSIHHIDSTMQTVPAVQTASTGMRRDLIEAIKDQGDELATGLRGLNFFDVDEKTHPLYHPGKDGKVDYKNLLAKARLLPATATLEERLAELNRSKAISTAASEAADASPQAQARQTNLLNRARSTGGGKVLDAMGNPFDRNNPLRTTENIGALRKYIGLSFKNGHANFMVLPEMAALGKYIQTVARNPVESLTGAAMNLADPDAIKALFQGKPKEALEKGAIGAGIGAGITEALKVSPMQQARLASYASKIPGVASQIPKALSIGAGVARFVGPASMAVAGYQLADAILEGSTGEGFVDTIKQVQDKERTAEINEAAVESAAKSKQLAVEKELPKPIIDSDTIEKFVTDPINELEYGWKKLTGQV